MVIRKAETTDLAIDRAANQRGANYWRQKGYDVLANDPGPHTPSGILPWGENVDMDKWFIQHGKVKPSV